MAGVGACHRWANFLQAVENSVAAGSGGVSPTSRRVGSGSRTGRISPDGARPPAVRSAGVGAIPRCSGARRPACRFRTHRHWACPPLARLRPGTRATIVAAASWPSFRRWSGVPAPPPTADCRRRHPSPVAVGWRSPCVLGPAPRPQGFSRRESSPQCPSAPATSPPALESPAPTLRLVLDRAQEACAGASAELAHVDVQQEDLRRRLRIKFCDKN